MERKEKSLAMSLIMAILCLLVFNPNASAQNGGEQKGECFDSTFVGYRTDLFREEVMFVYNDRTGRSYTQVYQFERTNFETMSNRFSDAFDAGHRPYALVDRGVDFGNQAIVVIDPVTCMITVYAEEEPTMKNSYEAPCPDFSNKGRKFKL